MNSKQWGATILGVGTLLTGCTMKMSFEYSTMKQWDRPAESTVIRSEDTSTNVKQAPKIEVITPEPINMNPAPKPEAPTPKPQSSLEPDQNTPELEPKTSFIHLPHSDEHVCMMVKK